MVTFVHGQLELPLPAEVTAVEHVGMVVGLRGAVGFHPLLPARFPRFQDNVVVGNSPEAEPAPEGDEIAIIAHLQVNGLEEEAVVGVHGGSGILLLLGGWARASRVSRVLALLLALPPGGSVGHAGPAGRATGWSVVGGAVVVGVGAVDEVDEARDVAKVRPAFRCVRYFPVFPTFSCFIFAKTGKESAATTQEVQEILGFVEMSCCHHFKQVIPQKTGQVRKWYPTKNRPKKEREKRETRDVGGCDRNP